METCGSTMIPFVPRKIEPCPGISVFPSCESTSWGGRRSPSYQVTVTVLPAVNLRAGEGVMHDGVVGPVGFVRRRAFALHGERRGQGQGLEDRVVDMAAHVAERAGAEVEPLAPVAGMVVAAADEGPLADDAQPQNPS